MELPRDLQAEVRRQMAAERATRRVTAAPLSSSGGSTNNKKRQRSGVADGAAGGIRAFFQRKDSK
jgi:hypothetical protein